MPHPSQPIELLRRLVSLHSGSRNPEGVDRVQAVLRPELEAIGLKCRTLANPSPAQTSGKLLIAERLAPGRGAPVVTLVTHADTVEAGVRRESAFKLQGDRAHGIGTIDDKGGQVVALEGLRRFLNARTAGAPPFGIRLISAPSEELGSPGFQETLARLSLETSLVLGFEPSLDDGSIIDARRGNRWYHIEVEGREAHSGRAHRDGVNAAHELALKIAELHRLTDYQRDVTVSVGSLGGGDGSYNTVCAHAEARLDTRFGDHATGARLHARIEKILQAPRVRSARDKTPARTHWEIADDCPAFASVAAARPHATAYLKAIRATERRAVRATRSGGGADSCYMSRPGLAILDGLGPTGGGMHTPGEWLHVPSLETRARALALFLESLAQRGLSARKAKP